MMRLNDLKGRAVVELDSAEKLGQIDEVVLDLDRQRVAGFVIGRPQGLFTSSGGGRVLPASGIQAIGPDAVTVRSTTGDDGELERIEALPRTVGIVGRKVVSHSGRLLGIIEDVLIDPQGGRILGYALERSGGGTGLMSFLDSHRKEAFDYVRADVDVRLGKALVVVPDEALVRSSDHSGQEVQEPAAADWERHPASETTRAETTAEYGGAHADQPHHGSPSASATEETLRITPR